MLHSYGSVHVATNYCDYWHTTRNLTVKLTAYVYKPTYRSTRMRLDLTIMTARPYRSAYYSKCNACRQLDEGRSASIRNVYGIVNHFTALQITVTTRKRGNCECIAT